MNAATQKIRTWRESPCQFVTEVFGVTLDRWQEEALSAIGGPAQPRRRLALKACTGPGKSATLAWIGWHRLLCFAGRGEHPKGAALSGEGSDNLRDNLWAELSKWQGRAPLLQRAFTWTKERIFANDHPSTWFLSARSYPRDANTEAVGRSLSGLHSEYPFILLDETGAMPPAVGQKAEQAFTGGVKDGLIAAAGNPTSTAGLLYTICTLLREQWAVITITADPDDPNRTPRVDIELAREQIRLYGRDNPWIMSTILGLFPPTSVNSLLGPDQVEAAMEKHYRGPEYQWAQKRLGVDVARFGDDRTVLFPRQGLASFAPLIMRHDRDKDAPSVDIANRVMTFKREFQHETEIFDDTGGWAKGAIDVLRASGFSPVPIQFHSKRCAEQYYNKRAEMWWEMAEWVKRGGALPPVRELVRELTSPTYSYVGGKILIEPKEMIKKRLGASPDIADALALTFAMPDQPAEMRGQMAQGLKKFANGKTSYNPLE